METHEQVNIQNEKKTDASRINRIYEIHSTPIQDIMEQVPNWFIRAGIVLIFLIMVFVLLSAWVIRYPQIITARISVTTPTPPSPIISRATGKLTLLVQDGELVEKEEILGIIENPANLDNVISLKAALTQLEPHILEHRYPIHFTPISHAILGSLQEPYARFLQSYANYNRFHSRETTHFQQSLDVLHKQINYSEDIITQLEENQILVEHELQLAERELQTNRELFEKGHFSEKDLANSERAHLRIRQALEDLKIRQINARLQRTVQQKEAVDLDFQYGAQRESYQIDLQSSFKQLQNSLLAWEETYLLTATTSGKVSLHSYWSNNQYVHSSQEVVIIVPLQPEEEFIGKMLLPSSGAGRVEIGQQVRIKFDSYPYEEFGAVMGKVTAISLVARENQYVLDVILNKGLHTTYNKKITFKQEMQGSADIITDDLRLIERVFNQFRSLIYNSP